VILNLTWVDDDIIFSWAFFVNNKVIAPRILGEFAARIIFTAITGSVFGLPYYPGFITSVHLVFLVSYFMSASYQTAIHGATLGLDSLFWGYHGSDLLFLCLRYSRRVYIIESSVVNT
jgi:hypothetical protein